MCVCQALLVATLNIRDKFHRKRMRWSAWNSKVVSSQFSILDRTNHTTARMITIFCNWYNTICLHLPKLGVCACVNAACMWKSWLIHTKQFGILNYSGHLICTKRPFYSIRVCVCVFLPVCDWTNSCSYSTYFIIWKAVGQMPRRLQSIGIALRASWTRNSKQKNAALALSAAVRWWYLKIVCLLWLVYCATQSTCAILHAHKKHGECVLASCYCCLVSLESMDTNVECGIRWITLNAFQKLCDYGELVNWNGTLSPQLEQL